ncbi:DMT family transporter [Thalassoglobus sp.]|uniref:DMT family transporter n=1 Tax=Thalassoglobus sp. TaxID=2795869 RepID=UPI003AA7E3C4
MFRSSQQSIAHIQMGLAILLFGTALPVSQILTSEVHVFDGTAIRLTVAAILFLPMIWKRRDEIRRIGTNDALLVFLIAASLVAVSGLMLCSTKLAPCTVICTVTSFTPIVTALGAIIFFRDRPKRKQLGWIVVAGCSALVLRAACTRADATNQEFFWLALGVVLSIAAVFCEAAGILFAKVATRTVSPMTLAALSTLVSVLIILPFAFADGTPISWNSLSTKAWLAGIWWGAGGITLGTWLWYSGIKQSSATTAAAFLSLLPFVTVAISWIVN